MPAPNHLLFIKYIKYTTSTAAQPPVTIRRPTGRVGLPERRRTRERTFLRPPGKVGLRRSSGIEQEKPPRPVRENLTLAASVVVYIEDGFTIE
jgi:hypothetical protein